MSVPESENIQGLRIWAPLDSFERQYNIDRLNSLMAGLKTVDVRYQPGHEEIYCVGDGDRVIHHEVDQASVSNQAKKLEKNLPITSCLELGKLIGPDSVLEEARVRELHKGLGRTAVFQAIEAATGKEFTRATEDIKAIFGVLNQQIYDENEFGKTPLHQSGLIYLLLKAARRHKIWTPEESTAVAVAFDTGFKPVLVGRTNAHSEPWIEARGQGFINRTSFIKKPQPRKRAKIKHEVLEAALKKEAKRPSLVKIPQEVKKAPPVKKSKAEIFLGRLKTERRQMGYAERVADIHKTYLGDNPTEIPIDTHSRAATAKLGVEAYLENLGLRSNPVSKEIRKYLNAKRSGYRHGVVPIIAINNIVAAKANKTNILKEQVEVPGLKPSKMVDGFRILRRVINADASGAGEDVCDRLLGDVVEAYLRQAFPETEVDASAGAPKAPEGYQAFTQFVRDLGVRGIGPTSGEAILLEHGIELFDYKFGNEVRRGISPENIEVATEIMKRDRPERAPKGTISIHTYCLVKHLPRRAVDAVIKQNEIEVGFHQFKAKAAPSLSPEAQERLTSIIFDLPTN